MNRSIIPVPPSPREIALQTWLARTALAGWLLALVAWPRALWRIHFSGDALAAAAVFAVLVGLPWAALMVRGARRQAEAGVHRNFKRASDLRWAHVCGVFVLTTGASFLFGLMAAGGALVAFQPLERRSLLVQTANTCEHRCLGCMHRLWLEVWPGRSAVRVCADGLPRHLGAGDVVWVTARYSATAMDVSAISGP